MQLLKQLEVVYNNERLPESRVIQCKECEVDFPLNNTEKVFRAINDFFTGHEQINEHVYVLALDPQMSPIGVFEISSGGATYSLIDVRQLLTRLLVINADGFVLAHNHPAQSTIASEADKILTEQVKKAAEAVQLHFWDHIIIAGADLYTSLREEGLLK